MTQVKNSLTTLSDEIKKKIEFDQQKIQILEISEKYPDAFSSVVKELYGEKILNISNDEIKTNTNTSKFLSKLDRENIISDIKKKYFPQTMVLSKTQRFVLLLLESSYSLSTENISELYYKKYHSHVDQATILSCLLTSIKKGLILKSFEGRTTLYYPSLKHPKLYDSLKVNTLKNTTLKESIKSIIENLKVGEILEYDTILSLILSDDYVEFEVKPILLIHLGNYIKNGMLEIIDSNKLIYKKVK